MREIYLDNAATTRTDPEVAAFIERLSTEEYGNTSSLHLKGVEAEKRVREASRILADILKCSPQEILYTSGGTESDNLAIIGTALAKRRTGNRIIISAVEHAAVARTADFLTEFGFDVVRLPVGPDGIVRPESLQEVLTPDVILVSCMYVNSETGAVQPVAELAKLTHEMAPQASFHVDAVQAFGKYRIAPGRLGIDLMSVSSHKFHGPKGVGFLYIKKGTKIRPVIYGGGHQSGMRSGTENVPGAAGMAMAAKIAYDGLEEKMAKITALRERLREGLLELPDVTVNTPEGEFAAPHVLSATFAGVRAEVLLHALEADGICISAGSACSSNKPSPSATLIAMGVPEEALSSTVRFSFCKENTEEDVDETLASLKRQLPMLRRFVRK